MATSLIIIMRTEAVDDAMDKWTEGDRSKLEGFSAAKETNIISQIVIDETNCRVNKLTDTLDEMEEPYVILGWWDEGEEYPFWQIRSADAEERLDAYITPTISVVINPGY